MKLTIKWLNERNACPEGIDWAIRNNWIDNFDLDDLDNVQGDFNGYISWLRTNKGVMTKFDSNGNMIHFKSSNGYEKWYKYDSTGNMVHFKSSNGYEKWQEYDSNGNLIHFKNSS
jgi:hypothetical protein